MLFSKRKKHKSKDIRHDITKERNFLLTNQNNFFIHEAYKKLRTNLMFSLADVDGCRVIVLTSAMQGDGKSTTAANLALSFAATDKRVLLVDCDLRRPKLGRLLQAKNNYGLSDILADRSLLEQAICNYKKNLYLLFAGSIPPNPSELLSSNRMIQLVEWMRTQYDYVIFDTPPMDIVSDAFVLASLSDGLAMVVRMGETDRNAITSSLSQLDYIKVKMLGFILNSSDVSASRYGRYGKYSGYHYGGYNRGYYRQYGYDYTPNTETK